MMLSEGMFARKSQFEPIEAGSGADFIDELKPFLDDIIITSPHKILAQNQTISTYNYARTVSIKLSWPA